MSLGSLARWQSTLLSVLSFTNTTPYLQIDIPMSVVVTTLISSAVFFKVKIHKTCRFFVRLKLIYRDLLSSNIQMEAW